MVGIVAADAETIAMLNCFLMRDTRPDFPEDFSPEWDDLFQLTQDFDFPQDMLCRGLTAVISWHDSDVSLSQVGRWARNYQKFKCLVVYVEGDEAAEEEPFHGDFYHYGSRGFERVTSARRDSICSDEEHARIVEDLFVFLS